jgi:hypothetical protein
MNYMLRAHRCASQGDKVGIGDRGSAISGGGRMASVTAISSWERSHQPAHPLPIPDPRSPIPTLTRRTIRSCRAGPEQPVRKSACANVFSANPPNDAERLGPAAFRLSARVGPTYTRHRGPIGAAIDWPSRPDRRRRARGSRFVGGRLRVSRQDASDPGAVRTRLLGRGDCAQCPRIDSVAVLDDAPAEYGAERSTAACHTGLLSCGILAGADRLVRAQARSRLTVRERRRRQHDFSNHRT